MKSSIENLRGWKGAVIPDKCEKVNKKEAIKMAILLGVVEGRRMRYGIGIFSGDGNCSDILSY